MLMLFLQLSDITEPWKYGQCRLVQQEPMQVCYRKRCTRGVHFILKHF